MVNSFPLGFCFLLTALLAFPHFLDAIKIEIRKVSCLHFPISLFALEHFWNFKVSPTAVSFLADESNSRA